MDIRIMLRKDEKKYKIVMKAINEEENITMAENLTLDNAKMLLEYYKENDYRHCYEIEKI